MSSLDLSSVPIGLLNSFGSVGKFTKNDNDQDPISGHYAGSPTEVSVVYIREFFKSKELIENLILNGDAKITFVLDEEPSTDWSFIDRNNVQWNIKSIVPMEDSISTVAYEAHIRK